MPFRSKHRSNFKTLTPANPTHTHAGEVLHIEAKRRSLAAGGAPCVFVEPAEGTMAATPSSPIKSPASPASLPQIAPLAKYKLGECGAVVVAADYALG